VVEWLRPLDFERLPELFSERLTLGCRCRDDGSEKGEDADIRLPEQLRLLRVLVLLVLGAGLRELGGKDSLQVFDGDIGLLEDGGPGVVDLPLFVFEVFVLQAELLETSCARSCRCGRNT